MPLQWHSLDAYMPDVDTLLVSMALKFSVAQQSLFKWNIFVLHVDVFPVNIVYCSNILQFFIYLGPIAHHFQ